MSARLIAPDACELMGVSYRNLDYWIRVGLVHCHNAACGSGRKREFGFSSLRQIALVVDLLEFGFTLEHARKVLPPVRDELWRSGVERVYVDAQGGHLDPPDGPHVEFMLCDWLVRTFTPAWLRKAGLNAEADELAALPAMTNEELAAAAMPAIGRARERAAAAWAAARAAAGDAAGDAAWDAARAAARAALADTVTELQTSACDLLGRMCEVGRG